MDYFIKEKDWKHIFGILGSGQDIRTKQEIKLRVFIEAVWYIARTECQWRLLPSYYGQWRSIHRRFKRWAEKGVWGYLFQMVQTDPDTEVMMIDATIIRAHSCSAGYKKESQMEQALGRSKGGFTTKIHALVDALGNPIKFILTPGQRNEITQAESLIQDISHSTLLADKGYDSLAFINTVENQMCTPVIPARKNRRQQRDIDEYLYKERHLIECFFGYIKHYRRVFSRFDKTSLAFLAFLQFVSTFIWLR